MGYIKRFEEIKAWQEARILTQKIYKLSGDDLFGKDFGLRDQIRRASVSTMANIAEGFDCNSNKEFARFLEIARRSAVEVQSLLYVALDVGYIDQETFDTHYQLAHSTKALIGGFRHSLLKRLNT